MSADVEAQRRTVRRREFGAGRNPLFGVVLMPAIFQALSAN